jgi:carbon-monoxide dehydrogenase large subunit
VAKGWPRQAHSLVLRAPHADAEIRAIHAAAAKRAPGVLVVLTGADAEADGLGRLPGPAGSAPEGGSYPPAPQF